MRGSPTLALLVACACACGEPAPSAAPTRPRDEPPVPAPMTPDELAEARRKAGFKDDDLAADKAQVREQGGRQYVKQHLAGYRGLVRALRRTVDDIDRSAQHWARASDPQRAYRRWRESRSRMVEDLARRYRELRREGVDAGSTQALVERIYRQWEDLSNDLGGDVAGERRFVALLAELRAGLDEAELALDGIERDDDL